MALPDRFQTFAWVRLRASAPWSAAAQRTVDFLAGEVGPREATSASYRRAATWVEQQLAALGYDVERQQLRAPKGVSWGVPVPAGRKPTWTHVLVAR